MFQGTSRVVLLEQLAKHHCKQFNIKPNGAFCAGFVRKIKENGLIQRALEADSLPTVESLIRRQLQATSCWSKTVDPVALRLSRKWDQELQRRSQ
jgi:hypothetical protein